MTNEYDDRIYRKLLYFYDNQLVIHFKLLSGEFRNGLIRDLNREEGVMNIKEFKMGDISILFEDINGESIVQYTTKVEGEENEM
jgi:hypothetical protein